MLEYFILLRFPSGGFFFCLKKQQTARLRNGFHQMFGVCAANNDATQYCETSERGAAEIRSQKRDRMRVQEVRAGGKVVVAGWIYRPCRFIEMSPSVSRYFWYCDEDVSFIESWKKKKRIQFKILLSFTLLVTCASLSLFTRWYVPRKERKGKRKWGLPMY